MRVSGLESIVKPVTYFFLGDESVSVFTLRVFRDLTETWNAIWILQVRFCRLSGYHFKIVIKKNCVCLGRMWQYFDVKVGAMLTLDNCGRFLSSNGVTATATDCAVKNVCWKHGFFLNLGSATLWSGKCDSLIWENTVLDLGSVIV